MGLSALLGLDGQGNAKTFKAWDRAIGLAPRFLYVCFNEPESITKPADGAGADREDLYETLSAFLFIIVSVGNACTTTKKLCLSIRLHQKYEG